MCRNISLYEDGLEFRIGNEIHFAFNVYLFIGIKSLFALDCRIADNKALHIIQIREDYTVVPMDHTMRSEDDDIFRIEMLFRIAVVRLASPVRYGRAPKFASYQAEGTGAGGFLLATKAIMPM